MAIPTLVQSVVGSPSASGTSATLAVNGTTGGNTIIVYAEATGSPTAVFTVSDNKNSGNYANAVTNSASGHNGLCIAHHLQIVGGNITITVSTTTSQVFRLIAEEWANVSGIDQVAAGFSSSNSTSLSSGATPALGSSGDLVVCFGVTVAVGTFNVGSGFTGDPNVGTTSTVRGVEYLIASSTAPQTGTWTFSVGGSTAWDCLVAAYAPVAAAPTDTLLGQGWV